MAADFARAVDDGNLGSASGLQLEQFTCLWMMGLSAERTLGKPKDWNGSDEQFDNFTYKYSAWLGGLPGNAEELLEAAATHESPIITENLDVERRVMAKGIHQSLRSLVEGKTLNIVKSVRDGNSFEVWRRLWAEYRPNVAGRKISLLENVMNSSPKPSEEFSTWYHAWLEDVRQAETSRGKPIDDDIRCAVALRCVTKNLRDHLIINTKAIADRFPMMHEAIVSWVTSHRQFNTTAQPTHQSTKRDPNAMEIGAMFHKGDGKYDKGGGKYYKGDGKHGGKFGGKSQGKVKKGSKPPPTQWWESSHHMWQQPWKGDAYKSGGKSFKGSSMGKSKAPVQFTGYCGKCWKWGHKKAHCPDLKPQAMDIGAMSATTFAPSSSATDTASRVSSALGPSVSARVGAVTLGVDDDGDWPCSPQDAVWEWTSESEWFSDEWCGPPWPDDDWSAAGWNLSEEPEQASYIGAISSSMRRSSEEPGVMNLMLDSGSQSTAVNRTFAPTYEIDESDKPVLLDIQGNDIASYGRKLVDVEFLGKSCKDNVASRLKVDMA